MYANTSKKKNNEIFNLPENDEIYYFKLKCFINRKKGTKNIV